MNNKNLLPAVFAYCTPVGWLIAMLMNHGRNSSYVKFHLRQALGLFVLYFALFFAASLTLRLPVFAYPGALIFAAINFCMIVFLIMGVFYAATGKERLLPLMGHWAQDKIKIIIP
jgi:uncharacterized membrane protein